MKSSTNLDLFSRIDLNTLKFAVKIYETDSHLLNIIYEHFLTTRQRGPMLALLYLVKASGSNQVAKFNVFLDTITTRRLDPHEFDHTYRKPFLLIDPIRYPRSDMHLHAMLGDIGSNGSTHSLDNLMQDQDRDGSPDAVQGKRGLSPAQYLVLFHPQLIPLDYRINDSTGYASRRWVFTDASGLGSDTEGSEPHKSYYIGWINNITTTADHVPSACQLLEYQRALQDETELEKLLCDFLLSSKLMSRTCEKAYEYFRANIIHQLTSMIAHVTTLKVLEPSCTALLTCLKNVYALEDFMLICAEKSKENVPLFDLRIGHLLYVIQFPDGNKIDDDVKAKVRLEIYSCNGLNRFLSDYKMDVQKMIVEPLMIRAPVKIKLQHFYHELISDIIVAVKNKETITLSDTIMSAVLSEMTHGAPR